MRTPKTLSDWADAQADLSLRWAHTHFVGFVMSRLMFHTQQPNQWPHFAMEEKEASCCRNAVQVL